MIDVTGIDCYIAGRKILNKVSCQILPGQKIGLVGRNGAGKTTLFKVLLGEMEYDSGQIRRARDIRVATVRQHIPDSNLSALDYVIASDELRTQLLQEIENCQDPNQMADLYDRLIHIDAYTAEARAGEILYGLGFDAAMQNRAVKEYSGGWRMRIALASALFQRPELLLLDEPTNHLDLETSLWLANYLAQYEGALLIISHERDFLNDVVKSIFHLKKGEMRIYTGNYDTYEKTYKLQLLADQAFNERIEAQRKHLQLFVDRFKAKASKAAQAQSRVKQLAKLTPIQITPEDPSIKFEFPCPARMSPPLVRFRNVVLGYGDCVVLKNISGSIGPEDRIALLGQNGNGKSTLAKMIAGTLSPFQGEFFTAQKLSVGYFDQHRYETFGQDETALITMRRVMPHANEQQIRAHLGRFGFNVDMVSRSIGTFSGGEKVRLVFAELCAQSPQILILDEPTNHLDIEMRESLALALSEFEGAVILITHDWHLLSAVADSLWVVQNKTMEPFDGTLDEYRKIVLGS